MPTGTEPQTRFGALGPPVLQWLGLAVGGVALQLTPISAAAQKLRTDLSLESQLTASNNAGLQEAANARGDLILDLKPRVRVTSRGGGLHLDLNAGVVSRTYLNGTQDNRLEPDVNMRGRATLVEGWVALDGSWVVNATAADPLTATASEGTGDLRPDSLRQNRLVLTPRVQRDIAPDWQLEAYSANSWTRREEPATSTAQRQTVRGESTVVRTVRKPVPTGALAEVKRQRQRTGNGGDTVLAIDALRAGASYRVLPQLSVGALVGQERSVIFNQADTDRITGVNLDWQPNERARLRASSEKRFFGQGFDVQLGYRTPFVAVSGTWSRQPGGSAEGASSGIPGNSIVALVDNVLTTRIPNPIDRADAVNRLVIERGLPANLAEATDVAASTPQLVRNGALNLVLLGVRHSAAISWYSRTSRDLRRAGDLSLGTSANELRQRGGSMVFSRRLTPTASIGATLIHGISEGLGTRAGETLRESRAQADVGIALNSSTRLTAGLGRQLLNSSRFGKRTESRASVGLLQNF
jgi:uncharacterized protein (PEP-CTERM system associated)